MAVNRVSSVCFHSESRDYSNPGRWKTSPICIIDLARKTALGSAHQFPAYPAPPANEPQDRSHLYTTCLCIRSNTVDTHVCKSSLRKRSVRTRDSGALPTSTITKKWWDAESQKTMLRTTLKSYKRGCAQLCRSQREPATQQKSACTQDQQDVSPDHHVPKTERRYSPPQPHQITAQHPRLRPLSRRIALRRCWLTYFQDEVAALKGSRASRQT